MPRPLAYQTMPRPLPLFLWRPWLWAVGLEIVWGGLLAFVISGFSLDLDDTNGAFFGFLWFSLTMLASWVICIPWFARSKRVQSFPMGSWFAIQALRVLSFPLVEMFTPWREYADPDGWFSDGIYFFAIGWFTAIALMGVGCFVYAKAWEKRAKLEKCKSN